MLHQLMTGQVRLVDEAVDLAFPEGAVDPSSTSPVDAPSGKARRQVGQTARQASFQPMLHQLMTEQVQLVDAAVGLAFPEGAVDPSST